MAYEIPGFSFTLPAGADFSAGAQFRFCDVNGSAKAVNPAAGGKVVGVRYTRSALNQAATIVNSGIAIVEAGGVITAGDIVMTNNVGQALKSATTGSVQVGIALESASGAGVQIAVLLTNNTAAVV